MGIKEDLAAGRYGIQQFIREPLSAWDIRGLMGVYKDNAATWNALSAEELDQLDSLTRSVVVGLADLAYATRHTWMNWDNISQYMSAYEHVQHTTRAGLERDLEIYMLGMTSDWPAPAGYAYRTTEGREAETIAVLEYGRSVDHPWFFPMRIKNSNFFVPPSAQQTRDVRLVPAIEGYYDLSLLPEGYQQLVGETFDRQTGRIHKRERKLYDDVQFYRLPQNLVADGREYVVFLQKKSNL